MHTTTIKVTTPRGIRSHFSRHQWHRQLGLGHPRTCATVAPAMATSATETASSELDRKSTTVDNPKIESLSASSSMPAFPKLGVRLEVLVQLVKLAPVGATTNLVCHEVVRQRTVTAGWLDVPRLTDPVKGYYAHTYRLVTATGVAADRDGAPPGTRSYAQVLQSELATRHLVADATHFVSHAWKYRCVHAIILKTDLSHVFFRISTALIDAVTFLHAMAWRV